MLIQFFDDRCIHRIVDEHADRIASASKRHGVLIQFRFQKPKLHIMLCSVPFK